MNNYATFTGANNYGTQIAQNWGPINVNMAESREQGAGGGTDDGLCLLSIERDGGGVRGLSALYVIERLMREVNDKAKNSPPLKPCEYFDMIGGTGTGGIIAIMLGRMRMSIEKCIEAYTRLACKAFREVSHNGKNRDGQIQGRFDHMALEQAIVDIGKEAGVEASSLLHDKDPSACKVFVTALSERSHALVTFSSYEGRRKERAILEKVTILDACRATSAASSFFDRKEIRFGPPDASYTECFIDAALGYNNPVRELWLEASDTWGGPLPQKINCLLSIGTGKPTLPDYSGNAISLPKRLWEVSVECEKTARQFDGEREDDIVKSMRYYRFNVDRGLESIGWEESTKVSLINRATQDYLKDGKNLRELESCAEKLAKRECASVFA